MPSDKAPDKPSQVPAAARTEPWYMLLDSATRLAAAELARIPDRPWEFADTQQWLQARIDFWHAYLWQIATEGPA